MAWSFEQPWFLLALLAIPLLIGWTWRRGDLGDRVTRVATALRCAMLALLALALAGLSLLQQHDELSVIYVVDASRSIAQGDGDDPAGSSGTKRARSFVAESLKAREGGDRAGVVVFGAQPEVESLVRPSSDLPSTQTILHE